MNTTEKIEDIIERLRGLWLKHAKAEQFHAAEKKRAAKALEALGQPIDVIANGEIIIKPSRAGGGLSSNSLEAAKLIADHIRQHGPQQRKDLQALKLVSDFTLDRILSSGAFRKEPGKMGRWMLIEQPSSPTSGQTLGEAAGLTK